MNINRSHRREAGHTQRIEKDHSKSAIKESARTGQKPKHLSEAITEEGSGTAHFPSAQQTTKAVAIP